MMNSQDPFNYPMPSRKDLMSLSTINASDNLKTTTKNFITNRYTSTNLNTSDIQGKINITKIQLFII